MSEKIVLVKQLQGLRDQHRELDQDIARDGAGGRTDSGGDNA